MIIIGTMMRKPLLITISKNNLISFKYAFTRGIDVLKPEWRAHLKADVNGKAFRCCLNKTE